MSIDLNNEELDFSYKKLMKRVFPEKGEDVEGWGCLIHPDEMRRVLFVGNSKLITTTGDQLEDYHLKNWIDLSIISFGQQMDFDIYPRLYRTYDVGNDIIIPEEEEAEWEDSYNFYPSESTQFFLKLRHKPISRLHSWELRFPLSQSAIQLKDRAVIKRNQSILRALFVALPYGQIGAGQAVGINAWRALVGNIDQPIPGAYRVSYTTGYPHSRLVPMELKEVLMDYITINVMSAYGDGIIGGMSNYSTSVGILSESIGTTMSATSAYYGARIEQLGKKIKEWWKRRKGAYGYVKFGAL